MGLDTMTTHLIPGQSPSPKLGRIRGGIDVYYSGLALDYQLTSVQVLEVGSRAPSTGYENGPLRVRISEPPPIIFGNKQLSVTRIPRLQNVGSLALQRNLGQDRSIRIIGKWKALRVAVVGGGIVAVIGAGENQQRGPSAGP